MSNLKKIEEQLIQAPSVKAALQLQFVKERFIANYQAVTGRKDGDSKCESELFAYMEIIHDKPELGAADRFSIFAGFVKAGTMGLSFRDNKLYVIPSKNKTVKVQSSPAGKREMLENMDTIKQCPEGVLVMKGDKFVHDKLNGVVKVHESTDKSVELKTLDDIVASYQRVIWKDGHINDVVVYHSDLIKARAKSPAQSDQSFWAIYPGEACKKVATNRSYRLYHKYPDNIITYGLDSDKEAEDDIEDVGHTEVQQTEVDQSTGEVKTPVPVQEAKVVTDAEKQAQEFLGK